MKVLEVRGLQKTFTSRESNGALRAIGRSLFGESREVITEECRNRPVLDDVSFSVKAGEVIVVRGPSGVGKSTLLNIIAGIHFPDTGDVFIDGIRVNDVPPFRRNVAYITQSELNIFPELSVRKNIFLGARKRALRLHGKVKVVMCDEWVARAAQEAHLELELLSRSPKNLSGGQLQRVSIARALAELPPVVLLDEPISNLDQALKDRLLPEMIELFREHRMTAVYVTHDGDETREIEMAGGRILDLIDGSLVERTCA